MKNQESSDLFNILYEGDVIRSELTYDEVTEALDELASEYYDTGAYNPQKIELELIYGKN
jgi:alcohol dehydrogenase YqhD (iron-dependent ADH family)